LFFSLINNALNKKSLPVWEGSYYLGIQNNQTPSSSGDCFLICFVWFIVICIADTKIVIKKNIPNLFEREFSLDQFNIKINQIDELAYPFIYIRLGDLL
jgi:hypothetical protein